MRLWNPDDLHEVRGLGIQAYGINRYVARHSQLAADYFGPGFAIHRGMTVLDIGANIGLFTLEVLRRCHGDARALAFEPAPQSFAYLERNLAELWPGADVRAFRCAVAAAPGEATFYFRPRAPAMSSLSAEPPKHEPDAMIEAALRRPPGARGATPLQRLPRPVGRAVLRSLARWTATDAVKLRCAVTTVSRVLGEHGIDQVDYLKIDVEGAELEVLRGIDPQDWGRIAQLGVEVHDVDGRVRTIRDMVASAGFDHVDVKQGWPFEGTNVYMLHARRTIPPGRR
jgi:FkbM family methyltransferase